MPRRRGTSLSQQAISQAFPTVNEDDSQSDVPAGFVVAQRAPGRRCLRCGSENNIHLSCYPESSRGELPSSVDPVVEPGTDAVDRRPGDWTTGGPGPGDRRGSPGRGPAAAPVGWADGSSACGRVPDQHGGRRPRRQRRPHPRRPGSKPSRSGADLAVFPELTVTGYPPEDLLSRPAFVADNLAVFARIAAASGACAAVIGYVDTDAAGRLVNAAALCHEGQVLGRYVKRLLPNYGVFDEQRWFTPGQGTPARCSWWPGVPVGVTICEDMWFASGPMADQAGKGPGCWSTSTPRPTRGAAARSGWPCWPAGCRRPAAPSSTSTRWEARTSWSSTAPRWS